jgi:ATP-dependent RNA helicase RhlB
MSGQPLTDIPFTSLDLAPELQRGVENASFECCTPIQAGTLPKALAGQSVQGQAQTGTGKTAAFVLATLHRLLTLPPPSGHKPGQPRAVVLAPTRELAVQIFRDAQSLGQFTPLKIGAVFGGTGYQSQREMLRGGVDVLIGTPGRLIDYFKQKEFTLKYVQVMVLDEADRMFDLGFIRDIRYVLRRMPPPEQRLNLLFSATLSHRVSELAYEHMNSPAMVNASPDKMTVEGVRQTLYHVSKDEKIALLLGLLKRVDVTRTLIFINTKRTAEDVTECLKEEGHDADLLSGDVPQRKRLRLLDRFTSGDLPILVATDVAARGLHIPEVSHVFNYDLPQDPEDYVHRIGRTARAGASGDAVSFACEEYVFSLMGIEELIGSRIPTQSISDDLLTPPAKPMRARRRRGGGGRQTRPARGRRRAPAAKKTRSSKTR